MKTYRLYCLDGVAARSPSPDRPSTAMKVASAEWIEAASDEIAIANAERLSGGRASELWQGNRLVARMDAQPRK